MGKLFNLAARKTDQMAMGCLDNSWLVVAVVLSKVYLIHQAAFHQEVYCPVDRCQGNFVAFAFKPAVDFIGIRMNFCIGKYLPKDQTSCSGESKLLRIQIILEFLKFHARTPKNGDRPIFFQL